MANINNTILEGSVAIVDNGVSAIHGYGDLTISRNLTVNSTSSSSNVISLSADLSSNFSVTDVNSTLTLQATGGGTNKVIVNSSGTGLDSIDVNSLGGINIDAVSTVAIDTTDTTNGVRIATATAGTPIILGTSTSTTQVVGNLLVSGTTTTLNTQTLTAEDPIFAINFIDNGVGAVDYAALTAGVDSGTYHIRANADVLSDTKALSATGISVSSASTTTLTLPTHGTLTLPKMTLAQYGTVDFLKTWIVSMTSGPAVGNTRRITANTVGPTPTITVSPAFSVQPTVGGGDTFELYAPAISVFYDESLDEYSFAIEGAQHTDTIMSPMDYIDIHAGGAQFDGDVNIDGDLTVGGTITIPCFTVENVILAANAGGTGAAVNIVNTDVRGSFMILVKGISDTVAGGNPASTNGASATFMASKRESGLASGSINRVSNSNGNVVGVESLQIRWPTAGKIQLYHVANPGGGVGETITYSVRVVC